MFFGKVITESTPFQFNEQNIDEAYGEVFSLTNITLTPGSKGNADLYIKKDSEEFLIASLSKDRPQVSVNLYVALGDQVTLFVKGQGIIHVVGFSEPEQQGVPFDDEEDSEQQSEEIPNLVQPQEQKIAGPNAESSRVANIVKSLVGANLQQDSDEDDDDFEGQQIDDEQEDDEQENDEQEDEQDDDKQQLEEIRALPQKQNPAKFTSQQNHPQQIHNKIQQHHNQHNKPQFQQNKARFNNSTNKDFKNRQNQGKSFNKGGKQFNKNNGGNNYQQGGRPNQQFGGQNKHPKPFHKN